MGRNEESVSEGCEFREYFLMKDIILVDFFDTVMFRETHSWQLPHQWGKVIKQKYGLKIDVNEIRNKIQRTFEENVYEIPYKKLIKRIYEQLRIDADFESFYNFSFYTEVYIDLSTQYPNKRIINKLQRAKDSGKHIYIVSDYPLPQDAYNIYLQFFGLEKLIDGVFCSETYHSSKASGGLYKKVLEVLDVNPSRVVMIGDSKESDYCNAKLNGIEAIRCRPIFHKIKTNCRWITNYKFENNICKKIYDREKYSTLFGEYSLFFYFFEKNLFNEINKRKQHPFFMARGGYLLKELYDTFSSYHECNNKSSYLKISRKIIKDALQNPSKKELLKKYLIQEKVPLSHMVFVDEGWNCSSQIDLTEMFNASSEGYYLGCFHSRNSKRCVLNGILFNGDYLQNYEGVFRSNLTFLEQICTSPEGSVINLNMAGNKILPVQQTVEIEERLYRDFTSDIQNRIILNFIFLCVWEPDITKKELAYFVAKSGLNGNIDRVQVLKHFDENKYENLTQGREKASIERINSVHNIKLLELLVNPCKYFRYFTKVRLLEVDNSIFRKVYPIFETLLRLYIGFFIGLNR